MKRVFAFLLSFCCLFPLFLIFPLPASAILYQPPSVWAGGYVLMEAESQKVLLEENGNTPLPPASTTKIMTCLVALENSALSKDAVVSENAASTEGSSAYLRAGEHISVKDLLYCLMLSSANDAAVALAENTAGSVEAFAELMNQKAKKLGLRNTHFTNPHGLYDENHYISAADMAILTAYALKNEDFRAIVSTKSVVIGKNENARHLTNHNRLLFSLNGCIGVKTGYTIRSGRCLVSACQRDGTVLICVTFNCKNDWETHTALFNYGFHRVKRYTLKENTFKLPLIGSTRSIAVTHESYSLLCDADSTVEFRISCPHGLYAPIKEGDTVGQVYVVLDGKQIDKIAVYATEEAEIIEKQGFFARLIRFIASLFGF